jgi:probable poly-beta-1,6-N-acetyl-D-glucosamine export protein
MNSRPRQISDLNDLPEQIPAARSTIVVTDPQQGAAALPDFLIGKTKSQSSEFLSHIHRLRGIAILLIVAVHCSYLFSWKKHPTAEFVLNDFWDNSTMLFVFISGYLFQHLSHRYAYLHYLRTKLKNVLLPYFITALPAVLFALFHEDLASKYPQLAHASLLFRMAWLYANGGSLLTFALWFIPVITLYYLVSPVLIQFTRYPRLYALLLVLLPFSAFGHRPIYEYGHNIQLAIYFLPVYLLGMLFSQYRARLMPLINSNLALLFICFLTIFVGHLILSNHHGKYTVDHMFDFQHGLIDWLFVQKLFFIVFLLGVLNKCNQIDSRPLNYLASISFTIYFFHGYVLYGLHWLMHFSGPEISVAGFASLYVGVVATCCIIATSGRKLFGKWSRSIIGS